MFETSYPDMLTTAAPQQVIAQVNRFLTLLLLWFNSSFRLFKRSELLVRLPDSHVFKLVGWNQSLTGPAVLTAFKLLPHTRCSEQRITQKGPFSDRQIFSRHLQTWKTQSGSFSSSHHTRTKVPPPPPLSLCRGERKQCLTPLCLPLWSVITQGISSLTLRQNLTRRGLGCELLCRRESSARHKRLSPSITHRWCAGTVWHKENEAPKTKRILHLSDWRLVCCLHTESLCSLLLLFLRLLFEAETKKKL